MPRIWRNIYIFFLNSFIFCTDDPFSIKEQNNTTDFLNKPHECLICNNPIYMFNLIKNYQNESNNTQNILFNQKIIFSYCSGFYYCAHKQCLEDTIYDFNTIEKLKELLEKRKNSALFFTLLGLSKFFPKIELPIGFESLKKILEKNEIIDEYFEKYKNIVTITDSICFTSFSAEISRALYIENDVEYINELITAGILINCHKELISPIYQLNYEIPHQIFIENGEANINHIKGLKLEEIPIEKLIKFLDKNIGRFETFFKNLIKLIYENKGIKFLFRIINGLDCDQKVALNILKALKECGAFSDRSLPEQKKITINGLQLNNSSYNGSIINPKLWKPNKKRNADLNKNKEGSQIKTAGQLNLEEAFAFFNSHENKHTEYFFKNVFYTLLYFYEYQVEGVKIVKKTSVFNENPMVFLIIESITAEYSIFLKEPKFTCYKLWGLCNIQLFFYFIIDSFGILAFKFIKTVKFPIDFDFYQYLINSIPINYCHKEELLIEHVSRLSIFEKCHLLDIWWKIYDEIEINGDLLKIALLMFPKYESSISNSDHFFKIFKEHRRKKLNYFNSFLFSCINDFTLEKNLDENLSKHILFISIYFKNSILPRVSILYFSKYFHQILLFRFFSISKDENFIDLKKEFLELLMKNEEFINALSENAIEIQILKLDASSYSNLYFFFENIYLVANENFQKKWNKVFGKILSCVLTKQMEYVNALIEILVFIKRLYVSIYTKLLNETGNLKLLTHSLVESKEKEIAFNMEEFLSVKPSDHNATAHRNKLGEPSNKKLCYEQDSFYLQSGKSNSLECSTSNFGQLGQFSSSYGPLSSTVILPQNHQIEPESSTSFGEQRHSIYPEHSSVDYHGQFSAAYGPLSSEIISSSNNQIEKEYPAFCGEQTHSIYSEHSSLDHYSQFSAEYAPLSSEIISSTNNQIETESSTLFGEQRLSMYLDQSSLDYNGQFSSSHDSRASEIISFSNNRIEKESLAFCGEQTHSIFYQSDADQTNDPAIIELSNYLLENRENLEDPLFSEVFNMISNQ